MGRKLLLGLTAVLLAALPFAVHESYQQYAASKQVMQNQITFHEAVAKQLNKYQADTVIGDYWDVTPIRPKTNYQPTMVPLSDCLHPQVALHSSAWQQAAVGNTVAYLLNAVPEPTGFKVCTEAAVKQALGQPTHEISINTPGHEGSKLYIYEQGVKDILSFTRTGRRPAEPLRKPTNCNHGASVNILAHEDDDLLFMNPDIQKAVTAKQCMASVYLTAGDAGGVGDYWRSRQRGIEAAYARMLNRANDWNYEKRVIDGRPLTTAVLPGSPQVRLIFVGLPDGDIDGSGFAAHGNGSLAKLISGKLGELRTVDGNQIYTNEQLRNLLISIMNTYKPSVVRALGYSDTITDGDHSDHHSSGLLAKQAFAATDAPGEVRAYMGYPVARHPENVSMPELAHKENAFFAYAAHDGATCTNQAMCYESTAYGYYLARQYSRIVAYREPVKQVKKQNEQPHKPSCVIGGEEQFIFCDPY